MSYWQGPGQHAHPRRFMEAKNMTLHPGTLGELNWGNFNLSWPTQASTAKLCTMAIAMYIAKGKREESSCLFSRSKNKKGLGRTSSLVWVRISSFSRKRRWRELWSPGWERRLHSGLYLSLLIYEVTEAWMNIAKFAACSHPPPKGGLS